MYYGLAWLVPVATAQSMVFYSSRASARSIREHIIKSTCDENVNQLTLGGGGGSLRPCNIIIAQNQPRNVFTLPPSFNRYRD